MKFLIVALVLVAVAAAQQVQPQEPIPILRQTGEIAPEGNNYQYSYETGNGISASEQGQLKAAQNEEGAAISAQGQYAYTAPDGTPIQVHYAADENGFQPQGAHLPVGPVIPEGILRSIEHNKAHPEEDKSQ